MEAVVERVAGYDGDQADIRPAWDIPLAQDDPAHVVLADQGDAPAMAGAYPGRDRTLAGPGVAPHDDQPRRPGARPHRLTVAPTAAVTLAARCVSMCSVAGFGRGWQRLAVRWT